MRQPVTDRTAIRETPIKASYRIAVTVDRVCERSIERLRAELGLTTSQTTLLLVHEALKARHLPQSNR